MRRVPRSLPALAATLAAAVLTAAALSAVAPEYSALWGEHGEKWTAASRLPDFSYAGYHSGEDPIPLLAGAPSVNVRSLGAIGDGEHDDSAAFLAAIAKIERGVIVVPAGRYKITQILDIKKSGVVLRGAGPDRTTLFFPKELNEVRPEWSATTTGQRTSNYSWAGGFVWLRGDTGSAWLTTVTAPAARGGRQLTVKSAEALRPGQFVQVTVDDEPGQSLASELYSGDPGNTSKMRRTRASMVSRIAAVSGNSVTLERALRFDVKLTWRPRLVAFQPTVSESGVENLNFEFPAHVYKGHFTELGFNPVALSGVAHCWVRNIRITNADSGPFVTGIFNTLEGVVYESSNTPWPIYKSGIVATGHHGVYLGGDDNLFTDFDFRTTFVHDLSVSRCGGNVYSHGKGLNLDFDHHKDAPYENLYTDIDAGLGTRLWTCGGGADLGRQCGARGTFWNIRSQKRLAPPPAGWGPSSMNFVGLFTGEGSVTEQAGRWFEAIPPGQLTPRDLHLAQLAARRARR